MLMRCWTFQIKPGRKAEALRLMEASIAGSRLPGLLGWYLVDVPGKDEAISMALWESSAAMTHADVVAHNERNLATGDDVLVGPPTMAVYEVVAQRQHS